MEEIKILKRWIEEAKTLVVLTGAGISVPSGIPDFRTSPDGRAEITLNSGYMLNNPDDFTRYCFSKLYHEDAIPNEAHKYLTILEKRGKLNSIITQNIDELHQKSGTKRVFPIHGSIHGWYCMECEHRYIPSLLKKEKANYCSCGGFIRPEVTLYGEPLDEAYFHLALTVSQIADTYIVIGSSLTVDPAASLIRYYAGHRLVIINKAETPYDHIADLVIHKDILEVIELLEK